MKYIVVYNKKTDLIKVIFEDEFMEDNEFLTQNTLIKIMKLLGYEYKKDFDVELFYREENKNGNN